MKIHPLLSAALAPFSMIYGALVARHLGQYASGRKQPSRLKGVVISVGNLTVGGTGKTPFVIYLMRRLQALNHKAAVLTRGYRSRKRPKLGLSAQTPVSDETLLLASSLGNVHIAIDADRYRSGRDLENAGFNCFVLDDGFQHVQLARDVDILLIDSTVPLEGARVLPAGPYREPPSGLARADIVLITRSNGDAPVETQVRQLTRAPVFHAQMALRRVVRFDGGKPSVSDDGWKSKKLFAFCGIGNPSAFHADLARWGAHLSGFLNFRDHHAYLARDIARIEAAARAAGAVALVCTEKDRFNLDAAGEVGMPLYVVEADLLPMDEDAFWQAVRDVLARKRPEVTL